jgi:hypothetical protein
LELVGARCPAPAFSVAGAFSRWPTEALLSSGAAMLAPVIAWPDRLEALHRLMVRMRMKDHDRQ